MLRNFSPPKIVPRMK